MNGSIVIPKPPAHPLPPFVASVPQDALTVPTDAALLRQLVATHLPEAPAIKAAFEAFGDPAAYPTRLEDALFAIDLPLDRRLQAHVSRLGAEAFVLAIHTVNNKIAKLGLVDDPDNLYRGHGHQAELFIHFTVRRLGEIAELDKVPTELRRLQLKRVIRFFAFVQYELQRDFASIGTAQTALVEYRRLLFDIGQTHYQALFDDLFIAPANTGGLTAAVKQLADHLELTTATDVTDKDPPTITKYRIDKNRFRDYFNPALAEFAFKMYSSKSPPLTGPGPEISFGEVLRQRREQLKLLDDLREGLHFAPELSKTKVARMPMPEPPKVHDNASWQAWARSMWDSADKDRPIVGLEGGKLTGRLDDICSYVSRYFQAFTVHVPYDLEEGSKQPNYLTRPYPRAINGCLTHDCVVYAIRWINILGQLFSSPSMPRELSEPRIAIVEMPSHVGVMIRASTHIGGQVLIAVNNQNAVVTTAAAYTDEDAANAVAGHMYSGLRLALAVHVLKARPTDQRALWNEIAKLSDKKLTLPFDDPSEPFLAYLQFNAADAAIAKELADRVAALWRPMQEQVAAIKDPGRRRSVIEAYKAALEPVFADVDKAVVADVDSKREPIDDTIDRAATRVPKDATIVETDLAGMTASQSSIFRYRIALALAVATLDISVIDPLDFFPSDGFPTDVR